MWFRRSAVLALVAGAPFLVQACATKGYVRTQVANSRAATDSALAAERDARIAADADLGARVAALRADLDTLRSQFNVKIAAVENGLRFVTPVTFAFDDATVTSEARPLLERFARVATTYYPNATVTVEGFADPAGTQSYNLALSRRRAENVRDALASVGLTGTPVRVVGYGESRPVNPGAEKFERGAQANRRVVFVIESSGADAAIALGPEIR
jgi:peptidoglycan-associated lipoprotein